MKKKTIYNINVIRYWILAKPAHICLSVVTAAVGQYILFICSKNKSALTY